MKDGGTSDFDNFMDKWARGEVAESGDLTDLAFDNRPVGFEEKWSAAIAAKGFTMIPNLLLTHRDLFYMTPSEFLLVVVIESFRWNENLPYPSVDTLAERMMVTRRSVTRLAASLESHGYLSRIYRSGTSNLYSTVPLIEKLNHFAEG